TLPTRLRAAAPTSTVRGALASTSDMPMVGSNSRICSTTEAELASPGLYTMPTLRASGTNCLMTSSWPASSTRAVTPVTLVPEASKDDTSCAAIGSVTAEYTTGMLLVAATTACADGVAMATMTSG